MEERHLKNGKKKEMPKLSPQLKKIRDKQFLTALEATGSPKEAAKLVGKIGSQGGKNPENVASARGSQRLKRINETMLDAALKNGVTPDKLAKKIKTLLDAKVRVKTYIKGDLETEVVHEDSQAIDKGITHALKIGVGGGYKQDMESGGMKVNILIVPSEVIERHGLHINSVAKTDSSRPA